MSREIQAQKMAQHLAAHEKLLTLGGLRAAVAELHGPDPETSPWMICRGCDYGGHDGEPSEWPCRTWFLIDGWEQ